MLTLKLMERLFPTKGLNKNKFNLVREREKLVEVMNRILPKYGISTYLRICAFLGNCGIETDYFRTTSEYASGWDYDISVNPRKARGLGNLSKGDGPRFKGGGLTQTTGKTNYAKLNPVIGKRLGIDFTKNPEKLQDDIEIAVESACIYWDDNNLNAFADRGEFKQLSAIVNRGDKNKLPLHWAKRLSLYKKCQTVIPTDFSITLPSQAEVEPIHTVTDIPAVPAPDLSQKNDEQAVITDVQAVSEGEPKTEDVLATAFDKNVSPEQLKEVSLSMWSRIWRFLIRPLTLLYTALEAGNIYAWLGVALAIVFAAVLLYLHRADIRRLWQKLVEKITGKFTN